MPALRCSLILALTLVVNVNANDAQANEPAAPIPLASSDRIHDAGRLIQAHQAEQALSLLRAEIATQPSPERLGHARHLLGLALLETEQFKEARDVLSLALAERRNSGTHLSDQVRMALGRAEAALENYATAAQIWAPLLRGPSSSLAMQAAIARAEAFKKSGRNTAARRAYTHFLKTWPHAPRYHDAELEIALLDLKRRRTRSAIERLHGLALHHPNTNAEIYIFDSELMLD